jgi:SET domain-containing protein
MDVYVAESKIHGVGVFAARAFAAGETVLVNIGRAHV